MKYIPHEYQKRAEQMILDTPFCGLFLEMGLGKTVITLTAVEELMHNRFETARVLVIAPKKVAEDTWSREAEKWDHLKNLHISKVLGTAQQRMAAAETDADIYVINRENVAWLVKNYAHSWKWDMVVVDELSNFKNPQSQRFKALRKVRPMVDRLVGLTGTPEPNGLPDLWSQIYLLDQGVRLGRTLGMYREQYLTPGRRDGYVVYEWLPRKGAQEEITEKLSDIVISMRSEDYITLPDLMINEVPVSLPEDEYRTYKTMEKECVLGDDVTAASAAAVMTKLLQITGGAVYTDDPGKAIVTGRAKIDRLGEILEDTDEPVIVFYGYKHEQSRISEEFRKYKPRTLAAEADIQAWNDGKIRLLLAHPASVGYGLNLQAGGHIVVWYSLPWSLELYSQANARLYRQGQTEKVIIHHLVAKGTVDERVLHALKVKDTSQRALMDALKAMRKETGC